MLHFQLHIESLIPRSPIRAAGVPQGLLRAHQVLSEMLGLWNFPPSHLCAYVLSEVHSCSELLGAMREVHSRLRQTHDGVTPPLFRYEAPARSGEVRLVYDSQRKLCSVLWGAIEGAAERYGEQLRIVERSCMKQGAPECRIEAQFSGPAYHASALPRIPEQIARHELQQELRRLVLASLPGYGTTDGATLGDLQELLQRRGYADAHQLRPAVLLEAVQQRQFAFSQRPVLLTNGRMFLLACGANKKRLCLRRPITNSWSSTW